MNTSEFGMKAWGVATVVLAIAALGIVLLGSAYLGLDGKFVEGTPRWIAGLYSAIKQNGNVVAGILGFSGLAWSNFYRASARLSDG
ncbi:hypothetical protein [Pseudomonas sp. Irchel s3f10]|uniref:hypothetical protein n=1 Tax=Pseudomonas sp. Irchel s3f10 TaxID=2009137 RepID=UPI00114011D9|nr:hypothetical protein [Pseudomonas sp. Irchel s3f10]